MFKKYLLLANGSKNWFRETMCGGEVTVLLNYFMDDITAAFK